MLFGVCWPDSWLQDLADELRDRTRQFRIIQKRLLVRFRDRNPTVVDSLESLLRQRISVFRSLISEMIILNPNLLTPVSEP